MPNNNLSQFVFSTDQWLADCNRMREYARAEGKPPGPDVQELVKKVGLWLPLTPLVPSALLSDGDGNGPVTTSPPPNPELSTALMALFNALATAVAPATPATLEANQPIRRISELGKLPAVVMGAILMLIVSVVGLIVTTARLENIGGKVSIEVSGQLKGNDDRTEAGTPTKENHLQSSPKPSPSGSAASVPVSSIPPPASRPAP
jgi:hypothetical protein